MMRAPRSEPRRVALAFAALLAAADLGGCKSPPPPEGQVMESGGWDFYLNGAKVGSETYILRRSGRQLQCTLRSEFPEALASAHATLLLSPRFRPLEFELESARPPGGPMKIEAHLEPGRARVRIERGELVREDSLDISPRARLLEEGLVTLGQIALQGLDLRRRDRFEIPVLLPQRFLEAQIQVENMGMERLTVGEGLPRSLRHLRFTLAGGVSEYWVDEQRRVVRYLSQVPAGELEARRQYGADRKRSSAARPPEGIDSPSPSRTAS
jgi:hypothetical protein